MRALTLPQLLTIFGVVLLIWWINTRRDGTP